jgi:hypothetical protein
MGRGAVPVMAVFAWLFIGAGGRAGAPAAGWGENSAAQAGVMTWVIRLSGAALAGFRMGAGARSLDARGGLLHFLKRLPLQGMQGFACERQPKDSWSELEFQTLEHLS